MTDSLIQNRTVMTPVAVDVSGKEGEATVLQTLIDILSKSYASKGRVCHGGELGAAKGFCEPCKGQDCRV